jgi:hypothetical protein
VRGVQAVWGFWLVAALVVGFSWELEWEGDGDVRCVVDEKIVHAQLVCVHGLYSVVL